MKNALTFKRTVSLISFMLLSLNLVKAQVGFNNPNPDASSVVDIKATDKGILIPRLTTAERAVLLTKNPANGLMVYDIDENRLYFFYSATSKWIAANPWQSTGDSTEFYTLIPAKIGVRTTTPKSTFSIAGNSAIGSSYAGTNGAPTNGLIVEGNLGVGVTVPSTKLQVNGTVTATDYALTGSNANGPVPKGSIIMWGGSAASIPSGWAICDGSAAPASLTAIVGANLPDLRERFVVGAGNNGVGDGVNGYTVYQTGGENAHTLSTAEMPSHSHSASSSTDGDHSHSYDKPNCGEGYVASYNGSNEVWDYDCVGTYSTTTTGAHSHTISVNNTGGGGSHENRPPFYALCYIIKL